MHHGLLGCWHPTQRCFPLSGWRDEKWLRAGLGDGAGDCPHQPAAPAAAGLKGYTLVTSWQYAATVILDRVPHPSPLVAGAVAALMLAKLSYVFARSSVESQVTVGVVVASGSTITACLRLNAEIGTLKGALHDLVPVTTTWPSNM